MIAWITTHLDAAYKADVLEVGSLNVNGSARAILGPVARTYLGVDLVDGPCVDMIADGECLDAAWTNRFDLVVSCEVGEHCLRPWRLIAEMGRVCKRGGHVLFTMRGFDQARGAFTFHHPPDRWRVSVDAAAVMFLDAGLVPAAWPDPEAPGVFVAATKP